MQQLHRFVNAPGSVITHGAYGGPTVTHGRCRRRRLYVTKKRKIQDLREVLLLLLLIALPSC